MNPASIVGILSPSFTRNNSVIFVAGSLSESFTPPPEAIPDCKVGSKPRGVLNMIL